MTDNTLLQNWDSTEADEEMKLKLSKLADWQALPENHFIRSIETARTGLNIGLNNGIKGLTKYIYGTHKGRYYLVGADSGVGKTTISDFMYILNAYESALAMQRPVYIFYYSFEISLEEKKARWVSYYLYLKFALHIPADYIQGRIPGMMVTDAHMELIRVAYLYVEKMMNYCNMIVIEDPIHPTRIFHNLVEAHYDHIGTVLRHSAHDPTKKGIIYGWKPKPGNEHAITMVVIDHIALLMNEQGFDTKHTMDLMSKYFVTLRNLFGLTPIVIQQFNTDITSTFRMNKKGDGVINPQRIDFGDSRYTFRDANIVLGLIKPCVYELTQYYKYNIIKLGQYFVGLHLMKNRHGPSQRMIPLFFDGMTGMVEDLPVTPGVDFVMQDYYDKAMKLERISESYQPK